VAEARAGRDPLRSRRRVLVAALIAGLAGAGVALAAASQIESPQQAAADTRAPSQSAITATVERTRLAETITAQGTVTAGRSVTVAGAGPAPAGEVPVVTAMPLRVGETVYPGQVLVQVCGRPLIALPGKLPAYRNLMPGDTGPDVLQLQLALAGLGYSVSDAPGTFGDSTEAAVAALYAHLGYSAPTIQAPAASAGQKRRPGSPHGGADSATPSSVVYLPMGEVWFVPSLPARVASIQGAVGSAASGTVMTLAEDGLEVSASLDPVDGPLVKPGMAASVWLPGGSSPQAARVTRVGNMVVNGSTGAYIPATLSGIRPLPVGWAGKTVAVTITALVTSHPVLAVPVAAIYSEANGKPYVLVDKGGRETVVTVGVGASVGGLVQVSAQAAGLASGEEVVLGIARQ
jgi:peptidoglycan hydrolase-like protein with peptidoglycan-binding domain